MKTKNIYPLYFCILIISSLSFIPSFSQNFSIENIKDIKTSTSNSYVSNQDNILNQRTVSILNEKLTLLEKETSAQVAVVVLKNTGEFNARDLSMELFNRWKVGQKGKDNGLIILLALDKREVFIRTGYGLEGAIPDAKATQIINNYMFPYFKKGDWDSGILAGVEACTKLINKEFAENGFSSTQKKNDFSIENILNIIIGYLIISLILLIFSISNIYKSTRNYDNHHKEEKIESFNKAYFKWKIIFILFPLNLIFIQLWYSLIFKPRVRKYKIQCDKCNSDMHLLSEKEEDEFLTHAQQMEENVKSKDYDVWLCGGCNNIEIFSYNNNLTHYSNCPNCGAKTYHQQGDEIITSATNVRNGLGRKVYYCKNCHKTQYKEYIIPKTEVVVLPMGGMGGGRGFGGGMGGGSFGGGFSGGGGGGGRF